MVVGKGGMKRFEWRVFNFFYNVIMRYHHSARSQKAAKSNYESKCSHLYETNIFFFDSIHVVFFDL